MKYKIALTFALSSLIVGCSTAPYIAPQSQIDSYFDNIKLLPQGGEVEHINYGRMKATQEPYTKDYDECQSVSFKGKSFLFGTREVSNPKHLAQFSNDYMVQIITAMIAYKKSSGSGAHAGAMAATSVSTGSTIQNTNYTQYSNTIFDDKSILSNLKGINELEEATLECVKAKGWVYIQTKK